MQMRLAHYKVENLSGSGRLLRALSADAPAAVQRQSKMYLGVPKAMQAEVKPPMTGGDVWRSMLPVGAPLPTASRDVTELPMVRKDYEELAAAVAAIVPDLPDVVLASDVIALLDPDLVARFSARMPIRLSRALREAGVKRLHKGSEGYTTYFTRCHVTYSAMSGKAIMAHHAVRTHTMPDDPEPVGEKRGPSRRHKGVPAATPAELAQRQRRRRDAAQPNRRRPFTKVEQQQRRSANRRARRAAARAAGFPWKTRDTAAAKAAADAALAGRVAMVNDFPRPADPQPCADARYSDPNKGVMAGDREATHGRSMAVLRECHS
jgi:hypothetical protein